MGNSNGGGGGGCNNYFCPLVDGKSSVIGFQFVMLYDSITRYGMHIKNFTLPYVLSYVFFCIL